jgi:hypothetical protein
MDSRLRGNDVKIVFLFRPSWRSRITIKKKESRCAVMTSKLVFVQTFLGIAEHHQANGFPLARE